MKKIFLLFLLTIILVPFNYAFAAPEYWCVCTTLTGEVTCTQSSSANDLKNSCTKEGCVQKDTKIAACDSSIKPATGGTGSSDPNLQTVKLDNPIGANAGADTEITTILGNVVKAALGIMGGLVLLMIVWGGFTWLTGMGNPEKIKAGTNTITWAVLGAVVVLGSYFLLNLVLNALSGGL